MKKWKMKKWKNEKMKNGKIVERDKIDTTYTHIHDDLHTYTWWPLTLWNTNPRTDMSLHSYTLSWLRANHSLLLFLNVGA